MKFTTEISMTVLESRISESFPLLRCSRLRHLHQHHKDTSYLLPKNMEDILNIKVILLLSLVSASQMLEVMISLINIPKMYTLTRRMMKKHPRLWPASAWFRPCQPRSPEWTRSPSSPPSRSREELLLTSGGEELLRMEEDKVLLPHHLKRKIKIQVHLVLV